MKVSFYCCKATTDLNLRKKIKGFDAVGGKKEFFEDHTYEIKFCLWKCPGLGCHFKNDSLGLKGLFSQKIVQ